jgi:protein-S-isoprenylcysteine O-methyltransferase Ste14
MGSRQFIVWSVVGAALHLALLMLPLCLMGTLGWASSDIPTCLFLALATAFCLGDLTRMKSGTEPGLQASSPTDQRAVRLARVSSLWILLIFWIALVQHAANRADVPPIQVLAGGLLMLAGVAIRWLAIHTLGSHFVTEITVRERQPLVQSGAYRWVRHPSETGLLAVVLGATVVLACPLAMLLWAFGLAPMTLVRLRLEERSLAEAFGPSFEHYARRVKRLIPFVC